MPTYLNVVFNILVLFKVNMGVWNLNQQLARYSAELMEGIRGTYDS